MIAALSAWHERHDAAVAALELVTALPAHVLVETYSVLTRLPSGLAVPASAAAEALGRRFAGPPLRLHAPAAVPAKLASAGIVGGASYDGLVALETVEADATLLTLDERAATTYRRLGVRFELI